MTVSGARGPLLTGASVIYPQETWVVPGDAASSFLYQKVAGTHAESTGGQMPLYSAVLSTEKIDQLAAWIDEGRRARHKTDDGPDSAADDGTGRAFARTDGERAHRCA